MLLQHGMCRVATGGGFNRSTIDTMNGMLRQFRMPVPPRCGKLHLRAHWHKAKFDQRPKTIGADNITAAQEWSC
jgi:hypothetical protein